MTSAPSARDNDMYSFSGASVLSLSENSSGPSRPLSRESNFSWVTSGMHSGASTPGHDFHSSRNRSTVPRFSDSPGYRALRNSLSQNHLHHSTEDDDFILEMPILSIRGEAASRRSAALGDPVSRAPSPIWSPPRFDPTPLAFPDIFKMPWGKFLDYRNRLIDEKKKSEMTRSHGDAILESGRIYPISNELLHATEAEFRRRKEQREKNHDWALCSPRKEQRLVRAKGNKGWEEAIAAFQRGEKEWVESTHDPLLYDC